MQAKFFRAPKLVWVLGLCVVAALLALLLWPETSEQPTVATGPTATPLAEAPKKSDPEPEPADTTRAPPAARDVRPSAPKPASQAPERTASVERKSAAPEPASAAVNESRNDAKPFPHIRNTLDKVFGSASGVSQADRRNALLQRGPTYNNVRAAKAAYRAGNLSSQAYEDTIWVLKTKRARQIDTEKRNYRAGHITRDEYKRRVTRIDREYEGS